MAVCWRVAHDDPGVASLRYRCLHPVIALARTGVRSRLSWGADDPLAPRPDALVFVKSFTPADLRHAERAVAAGVPVVLDVCDNPADAAHRASAAGALHACFEPMARLAEHVVTTGPAMAEALAPWVPPDRVAVVPDGIETAAAVRRASARLWRERALAAARHRTPRPLVGAALRAARRLVSRAAPARPTRATGLPGVVWFGNTGTVVPRFGLINLADVVPQLGRAAREAPFELVVVGADRAAAASALDGWDGPWRFVRWSQRATERSLRDASACVIPNSRDGFSIAKSANRAVLALHCGTPVVATRTPALEPLAGCVAFDDFATGVARYLTDPATAAADVARAQPLLATVYGPEAIAAAWKAVLP